MSRLDALEKAVVSLAKQAGLAYDLNGTGLENDPLGDADHDGIPNIMDSHPRSAIQTGKPLKKTSTVTQPVANPTHAGGSVHAGGPVHAGGMSNADLISTLTTLVLLQLVNNLQSSQGVGHQSAGVDTVQVPLAQSVQAFSDLQYDYVYLYDMYEKTYFFDDNNIAVDGAALISDLVATHSLPTSQQALTLSYTGPNDYVEMRDHYRKLWDSYDSNVGRPPHFAQQR